MAQDIVQTGGNVRPVEIGKDISVLLNDLITIATPYGHEHLLHPVIKKALRIGDTPSFISYFGKDHIGNVYISVGKRSEYKSMFSCHIDTAHISSGSVESASVLTPVITTNVKDSGLVYGAVTSYNKAGEPVSIPSILGADDKIGAYIMLKMINKGIKGLYVFHIGEERGCIGSKHSSVVNKKFFEGIERCIAFDRMNYGDVIAQQKGMRTASEKFTNELADMLNTHLTCKPTFKGNVIGMYTDSANYIDTIPECTNVSVGYWNQHGSSEHFDAVWVESMLLPAILNCDFEKLSTVRKLGDTTWGSAWNNTPWTARRYPSSETYVHGQKKKPHEVTKDTPTDQCPDWNFRDGLIAGVSREAMVRIIYAKIWHETYQDRKVSNEIYDFLVAMENLKKPPNKKPDSPSLDNSLPPEIVTQIEGLSPADIKNQQELIKLLSKLVSFTRGISDIVVDVRLLYQEPLKLEAAKAHREIIEGILSEIMTQKRLLTAVSVAQVAVALQNYAISVSNLNHISKKSRKYLTHIIEDCDYDD